MLLLVPEDSSEKPDHAQSGERENGEDQSQENVNLDQADQGQDRSKEKVELDLDDAPFLDEDAEEESGEQEKEEEKEQEAGEEEEEKTRPFWKRWWFLGAASVLLLLIAGGILTFFLAKEPTPPAKSESSEKKQTKKATKEPKNKTEEDIDLKEFWIPHSTDNGTVFLTCKFTLSTSKEKLAWEIKRKNLIIRDAIYYYLKNKELLFLRNKDNAEKLKKDILSVINQYLSNGQINNLLIEKYLIK